MKIHKLMAILLFCGASQYSTAQHAAQNTNEKVAVDYLQAMDRASAAGTLWEDIPKIADQYWTNNCIQHKSGVSNGRQGLIAAIRAIPKEAIAGIGGAGGMKNIVVTSRGEIVIVVRGGTIPDPARAGVAAERFIFNMYRIENGKIAEHWDGAS